MATYNGERYLEPQLASIANQTHLPAELVIRDDGSSDRTVELIDAFANVAPFPVRVLPHRRHLGYAQNFIGIAQQCVGDLICFADQDDVWRPEKIASVAICGPGQALFHDLALFSADADRAAPSFYELLAQRGFSPNISVKGSSMTVGRGFIEMWGWPEADSPVSHDFWVALLSTAFGQRVCLPRILVDHRLHESNTSGWIPDSSELRFRRARDCCHPDVQTLIELVINRQRAATWTQAFLNVLQRHDKHLDPGNAARLRSCLHANAARHLGHGSIQSQRSPFRGAGHHPPRG